MNNLFAAGGIVMWPLLGFSIAVVALIIERIVFWTKINRNQRRIVRDILFAYRQDPGAVQNKLRQQVKLPIARIFMEALELDEPTPEEFRLALESATQAELPILKRFNTFFETVISVSPLLGLLGTILGLINSFAALDLGQGLGTNAGAVTGGISEALVSTAAGLVVAIFTLLFANTFRGLYRRQLALIQEYGGQFELLHRRHYEQKKGGKSYASA